MNKFSSYLSLFFISLCIIQESFSYQNGKRTRRALESFGVLPGHGNNEINLCENTTLDASFYLKDGKLYAFKGEYYWVAVNDKLEAGYPKRIKETWKGLTSKIDTAFSYKNDEIFFFRGPLYWKFSGTKLEPGYPKEISEGFPGIPENLQAASVWGKNGHVYFFKGNQYWRYETNRVPPVSNAYPRAIEDGWNGIPNDLDAVVLSQGSGSKGVTYFVKGSMYWRFDDDKLSVYKDSNYASYPRPVASWWFGCTVEP